MTEENSNELIDPKGLAEVTSQIMEHNRAVTGELLEYTAWAKVPDNLKTKTGLRDLNLKPAPGQKPAAQFRNVFRDVVYPLYEVDQAIVRPPVSEGTLARLHAARAKMTSLRYCDICKADSLSFEDYGRVKARGGLVADAEGRPNTQYRCRFCEDRIAATAWAREVLADERAIILDTETTGLEEDSEIIEVAIINTKGEELLRSLVKPKGEMGATHIHGIGAEDVAGAPSWPAINHLVERHIREASRVVIYNADYDRRLIYQTQKAWGLPALETHPAPDYVPPAWQCAMEQYARWYGEWSSYHRSYKWQRLSGSHRALGDARTCLEYIKRMAEVDRDEFREEENRW